MTSLYLVMKLVSVGTFGETAYAVYVVLTEDGDEIDHGLFCYSSLPREVRDPITLYDRVSDFNARILNTCSKWSEAGASLWSDGDMPLQLSSVVLETLPEITSPTLTSAKDSLNLLMSYAFSE